MVCDINPCKMNDFVYFSHLRDNCFNAECGYAFFCYLSEIEFSEFNSLDIPVTQSKKDLCADLLSPLEKFLKFEFLLRKKYIKIKVKDMLELYQCFCTNYNLSQNNNLSIMKFNQMMRELGLESKKTSGFNMYVVSLSSLNTLATNKKWLHELDEDSVYNSSDKDYLFEVMENEKEFVSTKKFIKLQQDYKEKCARLKAFEDYEEQEEEEDYNYEDEEEYNMMMSDDDEDLIVPKKSVRKKID